MDNLENDLVDAESLSAYDELFPPCKFMKLSNKVNGSITIVATRRSLGGKPLYIEADVVGDPDVLAANMAHELKQQWDRERQVRGGKGGFVSGIKHSLLQGQQNRAARRKLK